MYDEYQVMDILNAYLNDIRKRFKDQLMELDKSEDEVDEINRILGYAITHSKDYKSVSEMSK